MHYKINGTEDLDSIDFELISLSGNNKKKIKLSDSQRKKNKKKNSSRNMAAFRSKTVSTVGLLDNSLFSKPNEDSFDGVLVSSKSPKRRKKRKLRNMKRKNKSIKITL